MKIKSLKLPLLIVGYIAFLGVSRTFYIIDEREQAIVTMFGQPMRTVREPGLYMKVPFIHSLQRFDKRVLSSDAQAVEYLTSDKKRVVVDHVSRWRITDPLEFYRTVRTEAGALIRLNDVVSGRLREEIAKRTFIDFVREQREAIVQAVSKDARASVKQQFGIELIDVRIKRLDLPREVQASVYARMQAERQRIAKKYRAEGEEQAREIRADVNKEAQIVLAKSYEQAQKLMGEGDAQATAIYASAYEKDPEFYSFMRRLETYERSLGTGTTIVLDAGSDLLKYLEKSHLPTSEPAKR
ncbi:MAG: HflC protein [Omnitrophica bacterium RIFCSPHIGHO2_02_FULL_51_18]|nr:MAG: HflC protein [Omnitrophica bacterium RIFCSPHIGHO2_02_FULL_51_18]